MKKSKNKFHLDAVKAALIVVAACALLLVLISAVQNASHAGDKAADSNATLNYEASKSTLDEAQSDSQDSQDFKASPDSLEHALVNIELSDEARILADALSRLSVNDDTLSAHEIAYIAANAPRYPLGAHAFSQFNTLGAGCEILALCAAFNAHGYEVDPVVIANEYMEYGAMPEAYSGSPYDYGSGLPPSITNAAKRWVEAEGAQIAAYDVSGSAFDDLLLLCDEGYPVLIWTTEGMTLPYGNWYGNYYNDYDHYNDYDYYNKDGVENEESRAETSASADESFEYSWYEPEHCVLLVGSDEDGLLVADSMVGDVIRDRDYFAYLYEACGSMAVVLLPRS